MGKQIAIFGSTGSIGKNALEVIDCLDRDYSVFALSCQSNFALLAKQAKRYRPKISKYSKWIRIRLR